MIGSIAASRRRSGGGVSFTTLDPNEAFTTVATLSNSDHTVTKNASTDGAVAMAQHGKASGKWFFDVTLNANPGANVDIGIVSSRFIGHRSALSASATTAKGLNSSGNFVNGDVVRVIVDLDANKMWFRINGVLTGGDPQLGTGVTDISAVAKAVYPAAQLITANSAMTFNFNPSAETGYAGWTAVAPPVNFVAWRSFTLLDQGGRWFAIAFAEAEVMASSGGANIIAGSTVTASHAAIGGFALANAVDGSTTNDAAIDTGGGANQNPGWFNFDMGSSGTRNATHFAIRARSDGGGAQDQAPRRFILCVSDDNSIFWKAKTGCSFTAFGVGERKELVL
jgi:hypothetical protein